MALKDWKIIINERDRVWFRNIKREDKQIEVESTKEMVSCLSHIPKTIWKTYLPNRLGGQTSKSKSQAMKKAKEYMEKD